MSSLTFDRYSGNVPVIDANTGIIIAPSFTPLFRRDSFQLAGLLTSLSSPGAYFFTPSEIIAINSACALIRADKAHMQGELVYTGREPFATLGEISACSPDGMLLGALDSITIDSATGMPVSFSTGAGRGIAAAYPQTQRMNPIGQQAQPWIPQTGWNNYQQPMQTWGAPAFRQQAYQPQPVWNPAPLADASQPQPAAPLQEQAAAKAEDLPEKKEAAADPAPVRISVQFTPEQQQEIDAIIKSLSQRNEIAQAKVREAEQKAAEAEEKALLAEAKVEEARRLAEEAKLLNKQAEAARAQSIEAEELPSEPIEEEPAALPYEEDEDGPVPTIDWLLAQKQAPALTIEETDEEPSSAEPETEESETEEEAGIPAQEPEAKADEMPEESEVEPFPDEALNGPLPQEIISKEAADAGWRPPVDLEKDNFKEASLKDEPQQPESQQAEPQQPEPQEQEEVRTKPADTYYDTISPEEFFKQIEGLLEPVKEPEKAFPDEELNGPLPQEPEAPKAEKQEREGITGPRLSFVLTSQLLEEEAEKQAKADEELAQLAERLSRTERIEEDPIEAPADEAPLSENKEENGSEEKPEEGPVTEEAPQAREPEAPKAEEPKAGEAPAAEEPESPAAEPAAEKPAEEPTAKTEEQETGIPESGIDYEAENANYRKQLRTRNLTQILGMILLAGSIAIATML